LLRKKVKSKFCHEEKVFNKLEYFFYNGKGCYTEKILEKGELRMEDGGRTQEIEGE
jgi:hypothetical protein